MAMQLKYLGLLTLTGFIIAFAIVMVLPEYRQPEIISNCHFLNVGWLEEFEMTYNEMPREALQCNSEEGSVLVILFNDDMMAFDFKSKLGETMLEIGREKNAEYYRQICSNSGDYCIHESVVYDGKINAVRKIEPRGATLTDPVLHLGAFAVAIIAVNSENPRDAQDFLEDVFSNKKDILKKFLGEA